MNRVSWRLLFSTLLPVALMAQGGAPPKPKPTPDPAAAKAAVDAWLASDHKQQALRERAANAVLDAGTKAMENLAERIRKLGDVAEDAPRAERDLAAALDSLVAAIGNSALQRETSSGMRFAGQYDGLKPLMPFVGRFYLGLVLDTPDWFRVENRRFVVPALRDLYPASPGTEVVQRIHAIAIDVDGETELLREELAYALAQWGDRSLVDGRIAALTERIAEADGEDRLDDRMDAMRQLADLHYALREYGKASGVWQQLLRAGEARIAKDARLAGRLLTPSHYYDAACSLALAGDTAGALDELERCAKLQRSGRVDASMHLERKLFEQDADLRAIRSTKRFEDILTIAFGKRDAGRGTGGK